MVLPLVTGVAYHGAAMDDCGVAYHGAAIDDCGVAYHGAAIDDCGVAYHGAAIGDCSVAYHGAAMDDCGVAYHRAASDDCGVAYHCAAAIDEDVTPLVENIIVVLWLKTIHPDLPQLVKQIYRTEFRNKTLASLKPEISQALPSLVEELRPVEDPKALSTFPPSGFALTCLILPFSWNRMDSHH